jgi:hypothetical protein
LRQVFLNILYLHSSDGEMTSRPLQAYQDTICPKHYGALSRR